MDTDELEPNSIDIELDENCDCCLCFASGFDTTYPHALRNYIDSNEFEQSITNINNKYPQSFYSCLCFVKLLCLIALGLTMGGIALMIIELKERERPSIGSIIAAAVLILSGFGFCFFCCRCYFKQMQSTQPMVQAIEKESQKYEERHCRWYLIAKRDGPSLFVKRSDQVKKFHLIIDINQPNEDAEEMV